MRHEAAPFRLLIWLAAAVVGWAIVIGLCLYLPQALAGLAVAGVLLWRKGQRPVEAAVPVEPALVRPREDVRQLVSI